MNTTNIISDHNSLQFSKTRREWNAYWEVDLKHTRNIHAIKTSISAGNAKGVKLSIFILPYPFGENILSIEVLRKVSITYSEFQLLDYSTTSTNKNKNNVTRSIHSSNSGSNINTDNKLFLCTFQDVYWTLPSKNSGSAVRIVLHGLHSLQVFHFEAYQGDTLIEIPLNTTQSSQVDKTDVLLQSPTILVKHGINMTPLSNTINMQDSVYTLQTRMQQQYSHRFHWNTRVANAIQYFTHSDIIAMLNCLFNSNLINNNINIITEDNCLSNEILTLTEPRILLQQLLLNLRTILRYIQLRDVSKTSILMSLFTSPIFITISFYIKDIIYNLSNIFNIIQQIEQDEQACTFKRELSSCCWSQFLVIMELICKNQISSIGSEVFFIPLVGESASPIVMNNDVDYTQLDAPIPSSMVCVTSPTDMKRNNSTLPVLSTITTNIKKSSLKIGKIRMRGPTSPTTPSVSADSSTNIAQAYVKSNKTDIKLRGFQRYCGLCAYHFPQQSCTNVVLAKHIVALR